MFLSDGIFAVPSGTSPRLQQATLVLSRFAAPQLGVEHLLAAALLTKDERLHEIVAEVTVNGEQLAQRLGEAAVLSPNDPPAVERSLRRSQFTAPASAALEAIVELRGATPLDLSECDLELFVLMALARFAPHERERWKCLDLDRLGQRLTAGLVSPVLVGALKGALEDGLRELFAKEQRPSAENSHTATTEFVFPPTIAPSENLSARVRENGPSVASPLDRDPLYREVFTALARALHRGACSHVVLVGERGVGQGVALAEMARQVVQGAFPSLTDRVFVHVDARHTAPEESRDRLLAILAVAASQQELIVCLDGFAALLRGRNDTSNKAAFFSALPSLRCQLVGLVTPREYEALCAGDPDWSEYFTFVELPEPDIAVALELARHFAAGLSQRFGVQIDPDAIDLAVVLAANYVLNQRLPGKAFRVLQQAYDRWTFEREQFGRTADSITAADVVQVVSSWSGVPQETLCGIAEKSDFEQSLKLEIFGQDHAVREVAAELGLIKAGFTDADKPASVMLFVGQTGTGKTEMAKALARFYSSSKRLRTYTLGNFIESHSVSGLIGVPPGYVGHDQGGRLINDLNADPYGVFLLDEADKAHPDVLQPMLNLFDEGWIRDQRGIQADATKSIFVLTTNVGQRMIADMARQQKTIDEIGCRMKEALSQIKHGKSNRPVFTAEFLARIRRLIVFMPLDCGAMEAITRKLISNLQANWTEKRRKKLKIGPLLIAELAAQAHRINDKSEGREGGRIVRKLIADRIETELQRAISAQPDVYRACQSVEVECQPVDMAASTATPALPSRVHVAMHVHELAQELDFAGQIVSIP